MCNMKNCDETPTWSVDIIDRSRKGISSARTLELCTYHVEAIEGWEFIEIVDGKELV